MSSNLNALFMRKSVEWETPQYLFDQLNRDYQFTLDVAASHTNKKCDRYFTKEINGLAQSWQGERCWMNPPYGREIVQWIKKAYVESRQDALIVSLLPARTDTNWWHDYCMQAEIQFIRGRLKFSNAPGNAPFPSALVIFK